MALKLHVIIGSTRPGRAGAAIGKWAAGFSADNSAFDVELVDLADFNLPLLDEAAHPVLQQYQHAHTRRWASSVASADAYVFVTPEYDYFPPAALVNAVQVLMREWAYKPAGIVSYGGASGGLRAAQQLRLLVSTLNLHALPQVVSFADHAKFLGDDGVFAAAEPMTIGMRALLDDLHKWATALKPMRQD